MAGGVEETESNAAIDTAAEQHSDPEALMRHAAGQVRLKIHIGALQPSPGGGRGRDREGPEEERLRAMEVREFGFKRERSEEGRRHRHSSRHSQRSRHSHRHCCASWKGPPFR